MSTPCWPNLTGNGALACAVKPKVTAPLTGHGTLEQTGYGTLEFFTVTGDFFAIADPSISGTQNIPVVQPINALVTFTPRLPLGELIFISNYLISPAYNALQKYKKKK
jgi:hypothetical protein